MRSQIKPEEMEEKEEFNSIETSEESSEEISSADSEDLKLLKSRILARRIIDEEDTYHPTGKPISYVESEMSQFTYDRVPILEISSPPVRAATPVSPTNVVPKSILKKPKEEMTSSDNLDRTFFAEKPIRKILPQQYPYEETERTNIDMEKKISNLPGVSETLKTPTMSESDTNSILSAAEAAKNRRIQSKLRSVTSEEEAAEAEARLAVVNQYTEIMREHSRHGSAASSRRSSFSEDQDQKHRMQQKLTPRPADKQEQYEASKSKAKNNNEIDRQKRNSQASDSKREIIDSRSTTPAKDATTAKEKRESRPSSRDQSPAVRKRERTSGASSRSSSKTRNRTSSRERNNRQTVRNDFNEQGTYRSRGPSRPSSRSRSSSRERFRATGSVESKIERLQEALESNKYRAIKKEYEASKGNTEEVVPDRVDAKQLALKAKTTVKSTMSYITDLILLMAAMYVYFFKKETLAVPFIILLLYRRVQEGIHGWIPRRWW